MDHWKAWALKRYWLYKKAGEDEMARYFLQVYQFAALKD